MFLFCSERDSEIASNGGTSAPHCYHWPAAGNGDRGEERRGTATADKIERVNDGTGKDLRTFSARYHTRHTSALRNEPLSQTGYTSNIVINYI